MQFVQRNRFSLILLYLPYWIWFDMHRIYDRGSPFVEQSILGFAVGHCVHFDCGYPLWSVLSTALLFLGFAVASPTMPRSYVYYTTKVRFCQEHIFIYDKYLQFTAIYMCKWENYPPNIRDISSLSTTSCVSPRSPLRRCGCRCACQFPSISGLETS